MVVQDTILSLDYMVVTSKLAAMKNDQTGSSKVALEIDNIVEFVGNNPFILKGEHGKVLDVVQGYVRVKFELRNKLITWESWFPVDRLKPKM